MNIKTVLTALLVGAVAITMGILVVIAAVYCDSVYGFLVVIMIGSSIISLVINSLTDKDNYEKKI